MLIQLNKEKERLSIPHYVHKHNSIGVKIGNAQTNAVQIMQK